MRDVAPCWSRGKSAQPEKAPTAKMLTVNDVSTRKTGKARHFNARRFMVSSASHWQKQLTRQAMFVGLQ
jgi:hypothetical protein